MSRRSWVFIAIVSLGGAGFACLPGCGRHRDVGIVAGADETPRGAVSAFAEASAKGDFDRIARLLTRECRESFDLMVAEEKVRREAEDSAEAGFLTALEEKFGQDPQLRLETLQEKQKDPLRDFKESLRDLYGRMRIINIENVTLEEATVTVRFQLSLFDGDKEPFAAEQTIKAYRQDGGWRLLVPGVSNRNPDSHERTVALHTETVRTLRELTEAVRQGRFQSRDAAHDADSQARRQLWKSYMPEVP